MDKVRARWLLPYESQKLHKMKRQLSNQVNSRHGRIVLLSIGHVRNQEIAGWVDCSAQWECDICVDAFGPLNLPPRHGRCLKGSGKRLDRHRATYSRKLSVRHFLTYCDLKIDRLNGCVSKHKKTADFLRFMKWVRRRYPAWQTLHVVLGNCKPHESKELAWWANRHKVRLYFPTH